jgi:hypothetical protein
MVACTARSLGRIGDIEVHHRGCVLAFRYTAWSHSPRNVFRYRKAAMCAVWEAFDRRVSNERSSPT